MNNSKEIRAYFFTNMYLSPIACGIQCSHVVTKMFTKYSETESNTLAKNMLYDWATNHVTKILLNGGYQSNLEKIFYLFEFIGQNLNLPYAKFHEEKDALNGALTCVGIVVPEEYRIADNDIKYDLYMSPTLRTILTDSSLTVDDLVTILHSNLTERELNNLPKVLLTKLIKMHRLA